MMNLSLKQSFIALFLISMAPAFAKLPTTNNQTGQNNNQQYYNGQYLNYNNSQPNGQYQDPYYTQYYNNGNYSNMNYGNNNTGAYTANFGATNMSISGFDNTSMQNLAQIFSATEGNLGKKVLNTISKAYFEPLISSLIAGLINKLPKFSFSQTASGSQPITGLPPQCDPFYMYRVQQSILQQQQTQPR